MFINFLKRKKKKELNEVDEYEEEKAEKQNNIYAFPIWLRTIVVIVLLFVCLITGLIIGYGVIGDGAPLDALKVKTWRHVIDIVVKD